MPGNVYVVDDDASFRIAIKRQLERAGHRVLLYESAEQVLDRRPEEDELGCILLDVRMPGLGGLALHGHLAELGSTLPVVFLMGYFDVSMVVKAIKAGADYFLIKPLKSSEAILAPAKMNKNRKVLQ